MNNRLLYNLN